MFVVKAHSFQQQARLAISLAWVAGYTNIVSILAFGHVTSHVSGTTSDLGRAVVDQQWSVVGFLLLLLGAFVVGAVVSGIAAEFGHKRRWESVYVLPMAIEAGLLTACALVLEFRNADLIAGVFLPAALAALAMGLQNATITRISSGVVRTTHVTGVLTDLGLEVAHLGMRFVGLGSSNAESEARASGERAHLLRAALLASILGSFALGAGLGTLVHGWWPRAAMFVPVVFLVWIVWQDVRRPIAEVEPSTLVSEFGIGGDARLAVYHLRRDKRRQGRVHRMPDLETWMAGLPPLPEASLVVLDLSDVTALEANSVLELREVFTRAASEGRRVILAGLDHEQVRQLRRFGAGPLVSPENTTPDLELAIARGLGVLKQA